MKEQITLNIFPYDGDPQDWTGWLEESDRFLKSRSYSRNQRGLRPRSESFRHTKVKSYGNETTAELSVCFYDFRPFTETSKVIGVSFECIFIKDTEIDQKLTIYRNISLDEFEEHVDTFHRTMYEHEPNS